MESIIIRDIKITQNRLDVNLEISENLKKYFPRGGHFFAEYQTDISMVPESVAVMPVLLNLLQFSWLADCILWVNEIDSQFYDMIPRLKSGFSEMFPHFHFGGTLIPARIVKNCARENDHRVLALFTGGVDATTTFLRTNQQRQLLVNINGWYKEELCQNDVYDSDVKFITEFAKTHQADCSFVRANFATFMNASLINKVYGPRVKNSWWFGFQHSMAFLGCAAVLAYAYGISQMYIASSYTFGQNVACVSDPRLDNCIKCAGIETIHDGYEWSRQDKIAFLVKNQKDSGQPIPLRVCSFNTHNCCKCEKCLRTMLALSAEGGDVTKFGFPIEKSLLDTVKVFLETEIMELDHDHILFWQDIVARMKDNLDHVHDPDVYAFLKDFPFEQKKKAFLRQYYSQNFFRICKRKIKEHLRSV